MKYKIVSEVGYTNWLIEEHVKKCGYVHYTGRRFTVYGSDKYSTYEIFFEISLIKVPTMKRDINHILKKAYHKNCKKFYKMMRVRN